MRIQDQGCQELSLLYRCGYLKCTTNIHEILSVIVINVDLMKSIQEIVCFVQPKQLKQVAMQILVTEFQAKFRWPCAPYWGIRGGIFGRLAGPGQPPPLIRLDTTTITYILVLLVELQSFIGYFLIDRSHVFVQVMLKLLQPSLQQMLGRIG